MFLDKIVVSNLRGYYNVGEGIVSGVVINGQEMR